MPNVLVGSVSAELLLKTEKFDSSIKKVQTQVRELNTAFRGTDANEMARSITILEEQLEKCTNVINEQEKVINELKSSYDSTKAEMESLLKATEKLNVESKKTVSTNKEIVSSNEKLASSYEKVASKKRTVEDALKNKDILGNLGREFKNGVASLDWGMFENKFLKVINQGFRADGSQFIRSLDIPAIKTARAEYQALIDLMLRIRELGQTANVGVKAVEQFHSGVKELNSLNTNAFVEGLNKAYESEMKLVEGFEKLKTAVSDSNHVSTFAQALDSLYHKEMQMYNASTEVTMGFKLLDDAVKVSGEYIAQYEKKLMKVYEAMAQGKGLTFFDSGFERTGQMAEEIRRLGQELDRLNQKAQQVKLNEEFEKARREILGLAEAINSLGSTGLNSNAEKMQLIAWHGKQLATDMMDITNGFKLFDQQLGRSGEEIVKFEQRFMQMHEALAKGRKFTILEDLVPKDMYAELTRIQEKIAQVSAEENKLAQNTNKAKSQMNSMSGVAGKLNNAMSTLKMTTSMLSSMFIWTFGMSLWEATKQTVKSKNEMESYLHQMGMSRGSISVFNKGLDETVEKFRKLNKYMVGETIAGIGMEFDLTARQMTKAMDVVAMIQNEYVRAGRKEEEATLAVKDILQGEFLRLSRETGVGKADLEATGLWSGDLKDIEGLMEALRKVGTDRHWDLFASKCTSLSDVISTAKNRISEFTASLIDEVSPIIIGGFNGLIDVVDYLSNAWEHMGGTMQMIVSGGLVTGLATAILMIGKNMGLVQIATNGFTNSLASMILKMDASQVKAQGLLKSLTMAVTGFKAEEVAGMGTVKMLATRILGLDANVVATHGFAKAITVAKQGLVGEKAMAEASNLTHVKMSTVLKETIISWKMLKIAILGVMAVGIIAFLGAVAQQCASAKESVDTFYEVVDTGKEMIEDAQKTYDRYGEVIGNLEGKMQEAGEGTKEYIRLEQEKEKALLNQKQAYENLQNIQSAKAKADEYNSAQQQRLNNINLEQQDRLTKVYENQGLAHDKASEKASKYLSEVENANRIINESYDAYENSLISSTGHMENHVNALKEAGASEEQREKYMQDYMAESYKVAEYWKEFKQGDFWAIFKIGLGELTKAWIDIANHPEVIKLMNNLKQTFQDMKPYIDAIKDALKQLGMYLVQLGNWMLTNPIGRQVAGWGALSLVLGGLGLKIASVITGSKGMWDTFKTLASYIPKLKDKLKDLGKTAEETGTVLGGGSSKDGKGKGKGKKGGVGGKYDMEKTPYGNSPIYTDWSKTSWGEVAKSDFKDNARNFLKMVEQLAFAMILITEAIILINAPMLALAGTGELFKHIEPQVRKGIEGLTTIAPVIGGLLVPITALMVVMSTVGKTFTSGQLADAGLKSAVGIALGLSLVAETIFMIIPSILALGSVGAVAEGLGDSVQKGSEAMKIVGESLTHLASAVPFLIGGIILGIAVFEGGIVGVGLTLAVVGGIALGMLLCAETVLMMEAPLWAIAQLGNWNTDLSSVERGAEAIKQTGIALGYLNEACSSLVGIQWNSLLTWIMSGGNSDLGTIAEELGKDDSIITKLNDFAEKFSQFEFKPIDEGKVESFKTLADGVKTISDAINTVKEAISSFGTMQTPSERFATVTGNTQGSGFSGIESVFSEFDNMKSIIEKLSNFASDINNMKIIGINEGVVGAITSTANGVSQVKSAVDSIKGALGGLGDAQWEGNFASGGIVGAIGGYLFGGSSGGGGDYVSSLGSSLQNLENAVKDVMTFNSHIQGIVGTGNSAEGGDSSGMIAEAVGVVQQIANIISQIQSTLSSGVQEIESTAKSMGKAVIDGISSGINENIGSMGESVKNKAREMGKGMADSFRDGVNPMSDYMSSELDYVGQSIDNKHDGLVEKAGKLAEDMTNAFKNRLDMNSPGIMARTMAEEMGYIHSAVVDETQPIEDAISNLATNLTENFTPNLETQVNVDFTSGDMLSEYQNDSMIAMGLANETVTTTETAFGQLDLSTTSTFANIGTTIGTTMTNIANTTKLNYNNIALTTKTQLANMQSQTTKNIGAIRQSWTGMQIALINSAEHIRSETGAKIQSLQNNMASFWRKVQNPALLLGAGDPSEQKRVSKPQRFSSTGGGVRKILRPSGYAGAKSNTSTKSSSAGFSRDKSILEKLPKHLLGVSLLDKYEEQIMAYFSDANHKKIENIDIAMEYLKCLFSGGNCVAGGWDFNWSDDIKQALLTWHTHFGDIYDPYLYVGKFENDDFPIRGIAPIALNYIQDAIGRTQYEFYYDQKYGSPLEAWNAGHFNCYDGALLVMALASALGFPNSHMVHGSWGGIGHVWAYVEGLGNIDATAIQGGYGLTAPSRTGVAGTPTLQKRFKHNKNPSSSDENNGNVFHGDINIHIDGAGKNTEEIGKEVRNVMVDLMSPNPATGI